MRRAVYKGSLDGSTPILKLFTVAASQDIKGGELVVLSSNKVAKAAAAAGAGTVLGIAYSNAVTGVSVGADDTILVDVNPNSIYEFMYEGTVKTSLTNEDHSKAFDLGSNAWTINLDDTTDGYLIVVGHDNDQKIADVLIDNRWYS